MKRSDRTASGAMDWHELRRRLERARAAMEEASTVSADRVRAVLEERAQALARVPTPPVRDTDFLEVVSFELSGEWYALETRYVQRVVPLTAYTTVPGAPESLLGVINLRGDILAVFDFRKVFGLAQPGLTDLSRVLVLGDESDEFGILADRVHEVTRLPADRVLQPPESVAGIGRPYVRGVTNDALIVLDGAVLLRDARFFIDQAEQAGGDLAGEKP
ncbi:MAG TPA: chemotaxis protein CheW [Gemmataceae bacterium]|jgi:purine-binding chemotaxis protein CheW|nr:chemotaxis protein CheW [Gemmataceae bacterium]